MRAIVLITLTLFLSGCSKYMYYAWKNSERDAAVLLVTESLKKFPKSFCWNTSSQKDKTGQYRMGVDVDASKVRKYIKSYLDYEYGVVLETSSQGRDHYDNYTGKQTYWGAYTTKYYVGNGYYSFTFSSKDTGDISKNSVGVCFNGADHSAENIEPKLKGKPSDQRYLELKQIKKENRARLARQNRKNENAFSQANNAKKRRGNPYLKGINDSLKKWEQERTGYYPSPVSKSKNSYTKKSNNKKASKRKGEKVINKICYTARLNHIEILKYRNNQVITEGRKTLPSIGKILLDDTYDGSGGLVSTTHKVSNNFTLVQKPNAKNEDTHYLKFIIVQENTKYYKGAPGVQKKCNNPKTTSHNRFASQSRVKEWWLNNKKRQYKNGSVQLLGIDSHLPLH